MARRNTAFLFPGLLAAVFSIQASAQILNWDKEPVPSRPAPVPRIEFRGGPLEANQWMAYFYLHRDLSGMRRVLDALWADGRLADLKSQAPLSAFFAQVFRLDSAPAKDWIFSAKDLDERNAKPLMYALWMAGEAGTAKRLGRRMGMEAGALTGFDLAPPDLLEMPIDGAAQMDILWGAFMGSGDFRYVRRVMDMALTPVGEDDERGGLVRRLAGWSLRSNWRQHGAVWMYSLRRASALKGERHRRLQTLIQTFRDERRLPYADGADIGALVLVHRDGGLDRHWRGPSEKAPRIQPTRRASPGDVLEVDVLFSGVELDQRLAARVRYDLEVTDPWGRLLLRKQNLLAADQPTPSGWLIQRARERVSLRFKEEDPAGRYEIKVKVRDLIAGTFFETDAWVELIPIADKDPSTTWRRASPGPATAPSAPAGRAPHLR